MNVLEQLKSLVKVKSCRGLLLMTWLAAIGVMAVGPLLLSLGALGIVAHLALAVAAYIPLMSAANRLDKAAKRDAFGRPREGVENE
jgi:hypothetical protein